MAKQRDIFEQVVDYNNKIKKKSQIVSYERELLFEEKPISDEKLIELGKECVEFFRNNKKARRIGHFLAEKNIHLRTWDRWVSTREVLTPYHEFALMLIGNRREDYGFDGGKNFPSLVFVLPKYCQDWREETERRSSLKASESKENKNMAINIIVEALPPLEKYEMDKENTQ